MMYDDTVSYKVIGLFMSNGRASTNSWGLISSLRISKKTNGTAELKVIDNQEATFSKVWYIKTPISQ